MCSRLNKNKAVNIEANIYKLVYLPGGLIYVCLYSNYSLTFSEGIKRFEMGILNSMEVPLILLMLTLPPR